MINENVFEYNEFIFTLISYTAETRGTALIGHYSLSAHCDYLR